MKQIVNGRVHRTTLRKRNTFPKTMYVHSSMYGTYYIRCDVLKNLGDGTYQIKYVDPVSKEELVRSVPCGRVEKV